MLPILGNEIKLFLNNGVSERYLLVSGTEDHSWRVQLFCGLRTRAHKMLQKRRWEIVPIAKRHF